LLWKGKNFIPALGFIFMVQSAAEISGREEYLGGLSAVQRVMPADESPAGELEIWTREPVNFWVVLLQKSNSQEALI